MKYGAKIDEEALNKTFQNEAKIIKKSMKSETLGDSGSRRGVSVYLGCLFNMLLLIIDTFGRLQGALKNQGRP